MIVTRSDMADAIRLLTVDALVGAQSGHPGTPLGSADIGTALFTRFLKFDPTNPRWPDRDRFVQSNGHGSMLIYSLLYLLGYEKISIDQIRNFRCLGSETPGHPEFDLSAGIEATTGPLGQGIANAVGMAVAERFLNARFGDHVVDHYTYALVGDGCLMEGISSEVISLAGLLKLNKLVFLWDDNRMSDDGPTEQAWCDDQLARFAISGWDTFRADGHDPDAIADAIARARTSDGPAVVACRTLIGRGVPRIQDDRLAHGCKLNQQDAVEAREYLHWPHPPFEVPGPILDAWRTAGRRGGTERAAWDARMANLDPGEKAEFDRMLGREIPEGCTRALLDLKRQFADEAPAVSSIKASGRIAGTVVDTVPEVIGGAPDLEAATQHKNDNAPLTRDNYAGRYIHYGVREHAMGSMMNGMALHGGIVPYGATFLVFSDYLKPSLRMSAMMGQPVLYVFSHDSIGIGKNGPTHQPVESLAALRSLPNLNVFRPADAVEAVECWMLALAEKEAPSAVCCSRQALPTLRREYAEENLTARGAYVLAEATGERRVTLLATGSEVSLAMSAREILEGEGIPTAVVSMPCWRYFENQDADYRKNVLKPGTVRVGIEAAVRLGWDRYIGEDGGFVGMSTFGASGPTDELFEKFGFTPENVVAEVRKRL